MSDIVPSIESRATPVAPGVIGFGSPRINWYLLETEDGLTVVDAGLPAQFNDLTAWIAERGYDLEDVAALLLTHGHTDHIGFAERLRAAGVRVLVHEDDAALARGEIGGPPMGTFVANLWRPAVIGLVLEIARGSGLSTDPLESVETFSDGEVLDVPGEPEVIHLPGHTPGSVAFFLPDEGVLLCGDAIVTVDLVTGENRGPQLMSMFGADLERAADSLDRLVDTGSITLLPGHGGPWEGEAREAVRLARDQ